LDISPNALLLDLWFVILSMASNTCSTKSAGLGAIAHIRPEHVFFGCEDVNSDAENFANKLRAKEWLAANVNAHDAKNQRENI
jgi:hypothetical protein